MNYRKRKKSIDRDVRMYERVLAESVRERAQLEVNMKLKPLMYGWTDVYKADIRVTHDELGLEAAREDRADLVLGRSKKRVVNRLVKSGGSPVLMDGAL